MAADVLTLRKGPPLDDAPGMLRRLADGIEAGDVEASSVVVIIPTDEDWPDVYGYGEHLGDMAMIGLLELAKSFFTTLIVKRDA